MGFQKIGLGGVLSFATAAAEQSMGRVTRKFGFLRGATSQTATETARLGGTYRDTSGRMREADGRFVSGGKSAEAYSGRLGKLRGSFASLGETSGMSMTQLAAGAMMLGSVMGGLARKVGDTVGKYNDFNKQMSVVRSVAAGISDDQFESLRQKAIELGSATSFTATQAAEGLESLMRAGFSVDEALGAARGTLDLAAADSMGLGEAAAITANIIRSMGMSAEKDSQRVADVLALTSARSNTNVTELGEAFKMASSTFYKFGISVEEGSAILGKLADSGLKATMGGTSFVNMMNKLVRPSKKAAAWLKEFNIQLTEDGKFRKVNDIVAEIGKGLSTITDEGERTAMAIELTGLRGFKALGALENAINNQDGLRNLEAELVNADGAAKKMADERLNNLAGQLIILESATEGFTIRLFDMFKGMDGSVIRPIVDAMSRLNEAWDAVKSALDEGMFDQKRAELDRKHGKTMIAVVLGIRDGVKTLQDTLSTISNLFDQIAGATKGAFGADFVQMIVQIGVVIGGIATVVGVVTGSMGMLIIAIGAVMMLAQTVGMVLMAAFGPLVLIASILGAAFLFIRDEGESVGDVLIRVWTGVKNAALDLWHNGIVPLWEALSSGFLSEWSEVWVNIQYAIEDTRESFRQLSLAVGDLWNRMTEGAGSIDFAGLGALAAEWIGKLVTGLLKVTALLADVATVIIGAVIPVMVAIRSLIMGLWSNVIAPFLAGLLAGWNAVWPTLRLVAMEVFTEVGLLIKQLVTTWDELTAGITGSSVDWQGWGTFAVEAVGWVLIVAMKLIKWALMAVRVVIDIVTNVVQIVLGVFDTFWEFLKRGITIVVQYFEGMVEAFKMLVSGDVLGAFKTAGLAILNFLLSPIRLVVGAVADLVDKLLGLSAVKKLLPQEQLDSMREFTSSMRSFADKGITLGEIPVEPKAVQEGGGRSALMDFIGTTSGVMKDQAQRGVIGEPAQDDMGELGLFGKGEEKWPGFSQLADLQEQSIVFDAQEQARRDQDERDAMADTAAATAEAVKAGLEDATLETTVNTTACVDGKEVSRSQAKHSQRLADRLGATTPPFVRRTSAEQGMIPPR